MLTIGLVAGWLAVAQGAPVWNVESLLALSGPELEALYCSCPVGPVPSGKVRGTALLSPGSPLNGLLAKGTRGLWQGKVFMPEYSRAVNRFGGFKVVKADVGYGPSWLDGGPALILDYSSTSLVYRKYRDEIRQVAPGLYLGLMYARTEPLPTLKLYFVLESCP